jgi:N-ethylmaleimide reductase
MTAPDLFTPLQLGALELPNRVVMAPLTRNRAGAGNVPHELNVTYYSQRASAGLIISEATQVVPEGQGYPHTPGIHSDAQVAGWQAVTAAVHAAGGRMMLQLWHVGRVSHPMFQPDSKLPVAPSAIAPKGQLYGFDWKKVDYVAPRALELSELPGIVESYAQGARNARRAGFDGVEIHGANGYLLDQFLRDGTNKRTDAYGGSAANRARLLLEVVEAVVGVWGRERTGVRLSPLNPNNDMADSDPRTTFATAARGLAGFKLAYVHVLEAVDSPPDKQCLTTIKELCGAPVIANSGYTQETAEAAIRERRADAIAFGKLFLANPDLPKRLRRCGPFNAWNQATFYGGGAKGYTDYPALP